MQYNKIDYPHRLGETDLYYRISYVDPDPGLVYFFPKDPRTYLFPGLEMPKKKNTRLWKDNNCIVIIPELVLVPNHSMDRMTPFFVIDIERLLVQGQVIKCAFTGLEFHNFESNDKILYTETKIYSLMCKKEPSTLKEFFEIDSGNNLALDLTFLTFKNYSDLSYLRQCLRSKNDFQEYSNFLKKKHFRKQGIGLGLNLEMFGDSKLLGFIDLDQSWFLDKSNNNLEPRIPDIYSLDSSEHTYLEPEHYHDLMPQRFGLLSKDQIFPRDLRLLRTIQNLFAQELLFFEFDSQDLEYDLEFMEN